MRVLPWLVMTAFAAACGEVHTQTIDAPPGGDDAPAIDGAGTDGADIDASAIDASAIDASTIDARIIDAPNVDAPAGPTPVLLWTFDGNANNTGSLAGYTFNAVAVTYGTGKFGMAANFGSTSYAQVAGMRTTLGTYADVTIGFWMKEPGTVPGQSIVDDNNRSTAPYGGIQLGLTNTQVSLCVSTTTNSFLSGGCNGFTAPSANTWHHWIIRYDGTGTGAGQGGATQVYVDDALVHTRANDGSNNPVWNPGIPDLLTIGGNGVQMDELRIYNQVFTPAEQCTYIIRGTWSGTSCALP